MYWTFHYVVECYSIVYLLEKQTKNWNAWFTVSFAAGSTFMSMRSGTVLPVWKLKAVSLQRSFLFSDDSLLGALQLFRLCRHVVYLMVVDGLLCFRMFWSEAGLITIISDSGILPTCSIWNGSGSRMVSYLVHGPLNITHILNGLVSSVYILAILHHWIISINGMMS